MDITKGVYVFENEKSTGLHRCNTYWLINVNDWEGKGDRLFQINNLHNVDRYTTLEEAFNNGNIEYVYEHILNDLNISTSGELEKITEGGSTGWRIKSRNPDNYGNIGEGAIDFSYSPTTSNTFGATGQYSFAEGYQTTASGVGSHAGGFYTTASGFLSHAEGIHATASSYMAHAEGQYTTASGQDSYAKGYHAIASGNTAHAQGYRVTASGHGSHAEGRGTTASGNTAHAEGNYTIAQNEGSHSEGKFNVGTSTDTIHETGIGTSSIDRKNAFEIYTDGTLTAPACTNSLIDARGNKALVTKEFVNSTGSFEVLEETNLNTYTPDFNAMYRYFEYTLNQDSTVNNPLNVSKGEYGVIVIKEDNTGGWNVNWGTNYIFSSSVTLNTNPNAFNIFKYLVLDTDKILIEFVANF